MIYGLVTAYWYIDLKRSQRNASTKDLYNTSLACLIFYKADRIDENYSFAKAYDFCDTGINPFIEKVSEELQFSFTSLEEIVFQHFDNILDAPEVDRFIQDTRSVFEESWPNHSLLIYDHINDQNYYIKFRKDLEMPF